MSSPLYTDLKSPTIETKDIECIKNSIHNILTTPVGSLEGMPEFGSRLSELVFSQVDHITKDLMKNLIAEAIYNWEDRINLITVDITSAPEYNRLVATISFNFKDDVLNKRYNYSIDLIQG